MSGYEALLEEYFEEESNSKITFEELGNVLESLTEFVNEDIQVNVEISLQEAEEESIKDKAAKVGGAIKKAIEALIAKINQFIEKITDAVKKLVAKAKVTLAQGGNKAMAKIVADNKYKASKDIKLLQLKGGQEVGVKLLDQALKAIADTNRQISAITFENGAGEVPASVEKVTAAFAQKVEKSSIVTEVTVKQGDSIKAAYNKYCAKDIKSINDAVSKLATAVGSTKQAQGTASKVLKGMENKEVTSDKLASVSKLVTASMKINTYAVNYASSLLGILAKNSAKLALAAVAEDGKHAVAAGKAKAGEAGAKVKETAGKGAEKVKSGASTVADKAKEGAGKVADKAKAGAEKVKGAFKKAEKEEK